MQSAEREASLERLENGRRCESEQCLEFAVWLVSFGDEAGHFCARHTRVLMRDAERWDAMAKAAVDA